MKQKLFFDTEFTGLHKNTSLISIGIISEDGRTFYAELLDYDKTQVNDWLQANVIDNLLMTKPKYHLGERAYYWATRHESNPSQNDIYEGYSVKMQGDKKTVKNELSRWLNQFSNVEIWSDCLAYDWVLFNDIFGTAFDIPNNIYYIPFDICTLFKIKEIDPDISREEFISNSVNGKKHNALYDAKVIRECYNKLMNV